MDFRFLENVYPVSATAGCVTSNGGITFDNISLKEAQMVWLVVHAKQAVGHATAITPLVGTAVATCATALPSAVNIWYGNVTTSDIGIDSQTAAKLFTLDVGVTGDVWVVFQIDPQTLAGSYDCLGGTVANSGQATNFFDAFYLIQPRYANDPDGNAATRFITD